jgi:NADPH-dependent 2,4-dienoyl-CoA reductase/sulfur reductase-like enzyme
MKQNRVLIIGGVATGAKAAARARRRDPHAEITIVERGRLLSYAGCGMPYYIQGQVRDFDLSEVGLLKGESPATSENVQRVTDQAAEMLAKR